MIFCFSISWLLRIFITRLLLLLVIFSIFVTISASAQQPQNFQIDTEYTFYTQGFNFGTISISAKITGKNYVFDMNILSQNLAKILTNFKGHLYAEGGVDVSSSNNLFFKPELYYYLEETRRGGRFRSIVFDQQGILKWYQQKSKQTISLPSDFDKINWTNRDQPGPVLNHTLLNQNIDWLSGLWQIAFDINAQKNCKNLSYKTFDSENIHAFDIIRESKEKVKILNKGIYKSQFPLQCFYKTVNLSHPEKNTLHQSNKTPALWFDQIAENNPFIMVHAIFPSKKSNAVALLYLKKYRFMPL